MASTHALGIAEVVAQILESVNSRADLARCRRVNRLWHDESNPLLWEVAPSCSTLVKLHRNGVLDKYLHHIRKQSIIVRGTGSTAEIDLYDVMKAGILVRMQTVALSIEVPSTFDLDPHVGSILQPSLRILQLPQRAYNNRVFQWVRVSICLP